MSKSSTTRAAAPDKDFAEKNDIATGMAVPPKPGQVSDLADRNLPPVTPTSSTASLVEDLPDDVKANLIGYDRMELEETLLKILATPGAVFTVDRIILTLWHNHKRKEERMRVIARLRALVSTGLAEKRPGSRGTYTISAAGKHMLGLQ